MRGLVAVVLSIATDTLPMNFILRFEASAESCGAKCRLLVVATGTITAETPRQFALFAKAHDVTRATVVLNSEGGSVDWGHRFGSCNPAIWARHYCRPRDRPQGRTAEYRSS